jgi:RNA polymerase sigma-70 factor (ECF subfamily)
MTSQRPGGGNQPRTLEEMESSQQSRPRAFPSGVEEAALVGDARRGDESAFAFLVERYGPMVLSLAYASTLSRADAEDVAQETFLVAWRGLARFRGDAAFSTWLYGLARSRCADRARRAAVRPRLARHGEADAIDQTTADPERRKTAQAILTAAARLPLSQRQAVLMRDVQGLSYEEIASLQDVPVGTVRSRIATGRRSIAEEVGEP